MREEMRFEIDDFRNFDSLVTLTSTLKVISLCMPHRPLSIPLLVICLHSVWLWTDGRTDGRTDFETGFIRSSLLRWPKNALSYIIYILCAEKNSLIKKRTHSASCVTGTGSVCRAWRTQNGFQMKVVAPPCVQGLYWKHHPHPPTV